MVELIPTVIEDAIVENTSQEITVRKVSDVGKNQLLMTYLKLKYKQYDMNSGAMI